METSSNGQLKNKSSTSKKALTRLCAVKIVGLKPAQTLTVDMVVETADQDNLSRLLVLSVVQKTPFHFNQEETAQFFAETVLQRKEVIAKATLFPITFS